MIYVHYEVTHSVSFYGKTDFIKFSQFPDKRQDMPDQLKPYWEYRDSMYIFDGVLMVKHRVLIPHKLRNDTLQGLHSAHQCEPGLKLHSFGLEYHLMYKRLVEHVRPATVMRLLIPGTYLKNLEYQACHSNWYVWTSLNCRVISPFYG